MDRIVKAVLEIPWAIQPEKLAIIMSVLRRWEAGGDVSDFAAASAATQRAMQVQGSIAVVPLFGTIMPRANTLTAMSGGTSAEMFGKQFAALVNDPNIGAIVLDVDSPGGAVSGVDELSEQIYAARGSKPVIAVANHLAASAAYWIATAADELVVTPTGEVGSIGVLAAHDDLSGALDKAGIKTTLVSAGKYKTEFNDLEPLSAEARAELQRRVDQYYDMFIKAVARNRGVKTAAVREGYGQGRVLGAEDALKAGMVDRVDTLQGVLARLTKPGRRTQAAADELEWRERRARAVGGD